MTILAYRSDMRLLARFMLARWGSDDPRQLSHERLLVYFEAMAGERAAATRLRRLTSLRSLFRWLHAAGEITVNPTALLGRPHVPRLLPRFLTLQEVRRLLAAPSGSSPQDVRLRAILHALYASGMRVGELAYLRLEALDVERGVARVLGKGRVERMAFLGRPARLAVRDWLRVRADFYASRGWQHRDKGWLFVNFRDGGRLSCPRIHAFVAEAGKRAGIERNVHPHLLRHAFATHRLQSGQVDIRELQELLGHKSISSTMRYTHVSPDRLRSAHERSDPLI